MTSVVFDTPGLIDVRAFTTFGISAKPNTSNPIGFFGTGLKYAVAVLCRLGASPRVFIGRDEYVFYTRPEEFRGKQFSMIRMRRSRWRLDRLLRATHHDLPITTEFGKNWKAWQAFRELEANTRDEGGTTYLVNSDLEVGGLAAEGRTIVAIDNPEFLRAYSDRDRVFLPEGLPVYRGGGDAVQVLPRPSRHLYYRGLRVADLSHSTLRTYNFLEPLELTEDRTLKYEFMARIILARHVASCDDEEMIEAVLTAGDDNWEHGLDMSYVSSEPSESFRRVMERRKLAVSRSATRYYGSYAGTWGGASSPGVFDAHPTPWRAVGSSVIDARGEAVMFSSGSGPMPERVAVAVVDVINSHRGGGPGSDGESPEPEPSEYDLPDYQPRVGAPDDDVPY